MTRFADALRAALAEMNWSQADFVAQTSAVTQPTLSRYLAGSDLPKTSTLDEMCRHFPERIREDVAASYLVDQIPPSAARLVRVNCVGDPAAPPKSYTLDKPSPGSLLERNLEVLGRRAINDANLAMVLDYLASSVEGREPISNMEGTPVVWTIKEEEAEQAARKALEEQERGAAGAPSAAHPPAKSKPKKAKYY